MESLSNLQGKHQLPRACCCPPLVLSAAVAPKGCAGADSSGISNPAADSQGTGGHISLTWGTLPKQPCPISSGQSSVPALLFHTAVTGLDYLRDGSRAAPPRVEHHSVLVAFFQHLILKDTGVLLGQGRHCRLRILGTGLGDSPCWSAPWPARCTWQCLSQRRSCLQSLCQN